MLPVVRQLRLRTVQKIPNNVLQELYASERQRHSGRQLTIVQPVLMKSHCNTDSLTDCSLCPRDMNLHNHHLSNSDTSTILIDSFVP